MREIFQLERHRIAYCCSLLFGEVNCHVKTLLGFGEGFIHNQLDDAMPSASDKDMSMKCLLIMRSVSLRSNACGETQRIVAAMRYLELWPLLIRVEKDSSNKATQHPFNHNRVLAKSTHWRSPH